MFREKNMRVLLASFLSGLYIFALVFSGSFHQHNESFQQKINQDGKKIHFSLDVIASSKDCPVCHFNSTNHFQIPGTVEIKTPFMQDGHPHSIAAVSSEIKTWTAPHSLRGPPQDFI